MINFLEWLENAENAEKDKTPQNLKYFVLLWYFVVLCFSVLTSFEVNFYQINEICMLVL